MSLVLKLANYTPPFSPEKLTLWITVSVVHKIFDSRLFYYNKAFPFSLGGFSLVLPTFWNKTYLGTSTVPTL